MISIREARGADAAGIGEIFRSCYGKDYAYPQYYDVEQLTKLIYSDEALLLVAEDQSGRLVGTASVIIEVGPIQIWWESLAGWQFILTFENMALVNS